ncbi:MAG: DUF6444 domain-containing protein [Chitinophagales bacterium]
MLPKRIQNIVALQSKSIQELIAELKSHFEQKLAQKDARIQELEDQISKNSQNSSKPPSTDSPYHKAEKAAPKSCREKTERKIDGQYKANPAISIRF